MSVVQVRLAASAIRHALHLHGAEHGRQPAVMTRFDTGPGHPVRVRHHRQSSLPFRAQVQVVLIQLAQQFPAPLGQRLLQRTVVQGTGVFPVQERAQPGEQQPAGREPLGVGVDVASVVVASVVVASVVVASVAAVLWSTSTFLVLSSPSYSASAVG